MIAEENSLTFATKAKYITKRDGTRVEYDVK